MKRILHLINKIKKAGFILLIVCLVCIVSTSTNSYAESTQVKVVKCYPNPATSVVNFDFPKNLDKNYSLQIYSFVGKQMLETPIASNKISITLNEFYRGIYVYQLRDKAGKIVDSGKFQVVK